MHTRSAGAHIKSPVLKFIFTLLLLCQCSLPSFAQAPRPQPQPQPQPQPTLTRLESLGQRLFFDRNLSEPAGTACASCHAANTGFASNHGSRIGVALGSKPTSLGLRNSMSNAYNRFIPPFSFINTAGVIEAKGGHFWDGRADTLALQALGPFLASAEMNNPNATAVVRKVAVSAYANEMRAEFGATILNNPELAFQKIGIAIAAFESTSSLQAFSSKYDAMIQGKAAFTPNESRGMALFMNPNKGNCAACHAMNPASKNPQDNLFSDFTYYALGVPRNTAIPQNANPSFFDIGLCGPARTRPALSANVPITVSIEQFCGRFRMPSLRNVAQREAFMHNGFFKDLREVLAFYATRNVDPRRWYGVAAVPNDLPLAYQKNIINDKRPFNLPRNAAPAFSANEADDMIAFLRTLSDGFFTPQAAPAVQGLSAFGDSKISVANPFGE